MCEHFTRVFETCSLCTCAFIKVYRIGRQVTWNVARAGNLVESWQNSWEHDQDCRTFLDAVQEYELGWLESLVSKGENIVKGEDQDFRIVLNPHDDKLQKVKFFVFHRLEG